MMRFQVECKLFTEADTYQFFHNSETLLLVVFGPRNIEILILETGVEI